jgi:four helix bundle protein
LQVVVEKSAAKEPEAGRFTGNRGGRCFATVGSVARDHRRFELFALADELVLQTYRATASFPAAERYGLQAQIRRAAVSVPTNIVEGSGRSSVHEYCRFLEIALSSGKETGYLLDLSSRLDIISRDKIAGLIADYDRLCAGLFTAAEKLRTSG